LAASTSPGGLHARGGPYVALIAEKVLKCEDLPYQLAVLGIEPLAGLPLGGDLVGVTRVCQRLYGNTE
jgi:hypothetical protein